jgi:hypothetical protein
MVTKYNLILRVILIGEEKTEQSMVWSAAGVYLLKTQCMIVWLVTADSNLAGTINAYLYSK